MDKIGNLSGFIDGRTGRLLSRDKAGRMRKEGRGKNSPGPFFFSEFYGRGRGEGGLVENRPGAPEV
jgi:hypothetical protein